MYRRQFRSGSKSPAWQRKEGKNPSGGLNAKGVASYRRENPGSKLKTAVTTKPSKLKKGSKAGGVWWWGVGDGVGGGVRGFLLVFFRIVRHEKEIDFS